MAYTAPLTYKGRPLVRCKNEIYYGSLEDPFVVFLQILTTKGKQKRTGSYPMGRTAATKKAYVELTEDSKSIEFFEGMV